MQPVSRRALLGVLLVVAVLTAGVLVSPSATFETLETLAADPVTFGFVVAGLYLVRPLFAWPTTPLAIVVGYGLGVTLGIPVAMVGVLVTVVPPFLAARWFVGGADSPATTMQPGPTGRLESTLERAGDVATRYYRTAGPVRGVTASRLAPIPSDVATCAAAACGVRLRYLLVGTAIGELPWTVAAVVVGASAATITADGMGDLGLALTVACVAAAAILLAGPVYRILQRREESSARRHPSTGD
ncbi:TVP38/TMEM64 family protein [Natrarchaeobaculum aegyptiacum]|uniref:TVP38/TMEM64 family protein n=1 Tax=Natrarchaeobaculum aegyptiacum TaxID=745377 RepID=A0A2Z2HY51_9EURY|nr:VTT domain-containing protein [Natrarchaeobaculum aegyptiacum]ARS88418.1 TVP38/TMEM64 family protein [Natrarchaeobaculum aegyptiacum]